MTPPRALFLGLSMAAWMLVALPGTSVAQVCTTTADCPKGLGCQPAAQGSGTGSGVGTTVGSGTSFDAGAGQATGVVYSGNTPASGPDCASKDQAGCGAGGSTVSGAPLPPPTTTTTTTPVPEMICQAVACKADSDCAAGMVCQADSSTTCSGGAASTPACAPNQVCPPTPAPTPTTCTTTTTSLCAFKWQLPCNTDSDCGDAFTCQPSVEIGCSGSSGSADAGVATTGTGVVTSGAVGSGAPVPGGSARVDGGTSTSPGSVGSAGGSTGTTGKPAPDANPPVIIASPAPPLPANDAGTVTPPTCTTTTSYPGYCQPRSTTCSSDADCPADWTCVSLPDAIPVSSGGGGVAAGGPAIEIAPVAPSPPSTGTTTPASKVCQSPIGFATRGGGTTSNSGSSSPGTSSGTGAGSTGTLAGGSTTPPSGTTGSATPTASGPSPAVPENGASAPKAAGGCAVVGRANLPGPSVALALSVLGLALGVARRRDRRSR